MKDLDDDNLDTWEDAKPLPEPGPERQPHLREQVLSTAASLITGDRNRTYGSPTQNFSDTANLWNTLLRSKLKEGEKIQPGDVAMLMIALKLARMVASPTLDNWVDIAGYAGCGAEADEDSGRLMK